MDCKGICSSYYAIILLENIMVMNKLLLMMGFVHFFFGMKIM